MRKNCEGEETNFGVLALLWLRLWKMFHRSIKALTNILVQNNMFTFLFLSPNALQETHSPAVTHILGLVSERLFPEYFSLLLTCFSFSLFSPFFLFLSFPPSPDSPLSSRIDKQRPHLSAGQGKCLSHLLQETWSPQEMWRWSRSWGRGHALGTGCL